MHTHIVLPDTWIPGEFLVGRVNNQYPEAQHSHHESCGIPRLLESMPTSSAPCCRALPRLICNRMFCYEKTEVKKTQETTQKDLHRHKSAQPHTEIEDTDKMLQSTGISTHAHSDDHVSTHMIHQNPALSHQEASLCKTMSRFSQHRCWKTIRKRASRQHTLGPLASSSDASLSGGSHPQTCIWHLL